MSGSSRGIGLAIALRAAWDGANVALMAKTASPHPKLEGTIYTAAEQIERAGGRALPIVGDVRDDLAVLAAVDGPPTDLGVLEPGGSPRCPRGRSWRRRSGWLGPAWIPAKPHRRPAWKPAAKASPAPTGSATRGMGAAGERIARGCMPGT